MAILERKGEERVEFIFGEEYGYLLESKYYKKGVNGWAFTGSTRYSYLSSPLSNDRIADNEKVYGVEGSLIVKLLSSSRVAIYTLTGQLVMSQMVEGGEEINIPLSKGFYMIRTDHGSHKVFVK